MSKMNEMTGMLAYIITARELISASVSAKCLLLYYASNVNKQGRFFKSVLDIRIDTGLSEKTIRTLNEKWRSLGILTVTEHSYESRKANDYELHLPRLKEILSTQQEQKKQKKDKMRLANAKRAQKWRDKKKLEEAQALGPLNNGPASVMEKAA